MTTHLLCTMFNYITIPAKTFSDCPGSHTHSTSIIPLLYKYYAEHCSESYVIMLFLDISDDKLGSNIGRTTYYASTLPINARIHC